MMNDNMTSNNSNDSNSIITKTKLMKEKELMKVIRLVSLANQDVMTIIKAAKTLRDLQLNSSDEDFDILSTTTLNATGNNILHYAVDHNYEPIVAELINICKSIFPDRLETFLNLTNEVGHCCLHVASVRGSIHDLRPIVKLLLENGADANLQSNNNETPLHLSAMQTNIALSDLLLEFNADISKRDINHKRAFQVIGLCSNSVATVDSKKYLEERLKGTEQLLWDDELLMIDEKYKVRGNVSFISDEVDKPEIKCDYKEDTKFWYSFDQGSNYTFKINTEGDLSTSSTLKLEIELVKSKKEIFKDTITARRSKEDSTFIFDSIVVHDPGFVNVTVSLKNEQYINIEPYNFETQEFKPIRISKSPSKSVTKDSKSATKDSKIKIKKEPLDISSTDSSSEMSESEVSIHEETEMDEVLRSKEEEISQQETTAALVGTLLTEHYPYYKRWEKMIKAFKDGAEDGKILKSVEDELNELHGYIGRKIKTMPLGLYSQDHKMNILHRSCWFDNLYAVEMILKKTIDINARTSEDTFGGSTALMIAAQRGHYKIVEAILLYPFKSVSCSTYLTILSENESDSEIIGNDYTKTTTNTNTNTTIYIINIIGKYFYEDPESKSGMMEFKNCYDRNFDKMIEEFWSKDYQMLRSIFSRYDAIDPFPLLNVKDRSGLTAMNYAIRSFCVAGDKTLKCVRTLMEISFVRLRDSIGRTLFHEICSTVTTQSSIDDYTKQNILQKLIDYGVSKYAKDNNENFAFGDSSVVKKIIKSLSRTDPNDNRDPVEFSYQNLAGQVTKGHANEIMEEVRSNFLTIHTSLSTIPGSLESLLKSGKKLDIVRTIEEIPKATRKFFEVCGFDESIIENEPFYSKLKDTTSRLLQYNYENLKSKNAAAEIVTDINSLFENNGLIAQLSKKLHDMKLQSLYSIAKSRKAENDLVNIKQKVNKTQGADTKPRIVKKSSSSSKSRSSSSSKNQIESSGIDTDSFYNMDIEVDMPPHSATKRPRDKSNDGLDSVSINKKKKNIESVSSSSSSTDRTDNTKSVTQSNSSSPSKINTSMSQVHYYSPVMKSVTHSNSSSPSKINTMSQFNSYSPAKEQTTELLKLDIKDKLLQIKDIEVDIDDNDQTIQLLQQNVNEDTLNEILKLRQDNIDKRNEKILLKKEVNELQRLLKFPIEE